MSVKVEVNNLESTWFELKVFAPHLTKALPGQYMLIQVNQSSEMIPLMINGVWSWGVSTLLKVRGKSTLILSKSREVSYISGPLGRPFPMQSAKSLLIYVSSWGLSAAIALARAYRPLGTKLYLNYKDIENSVIERYEELFDNIGEVPKDKDLIVCAGSNELCKIVSEVHKDSKVIALADTLILDGIGLCLVCRVRVNDSYKLSCCEGPWFDAHSISWEELIARQKAYEEIEKKAYEDAIKRLNLQKETS